MRVDTGLRTRERHAFAALVATSLAGCCEAPAPVVPAMPAQPPLVYEELPKLPPDDLASGTTHVPPRVAGQRRPVRGGVYAFIPPRTAVYHFTAHTNFVADLYISEKLDGTLAANESCPIVAHCTLEARPILRAGIPYVVNIGGIPPDPRLDIWPSGEYDLRVVVDESSAAIVRSEDPAITGPRLQSASRLNEGRKLGTFQSIAGGFRASCGGLGGDAVHVFELTETTMLRVRAITQFPAALELRDGAGASVTCVSSESEFELEIHRLLVPGRYILVLDVRDSSTVMDKIRRAESNDEKLTSVGVRGGYVIDVAMASPEKKE
jgi:hypothetical protein